jgi:predicted DCC family thiol-disulfide oxidoreductase YuxK
MNLTKVFYDGKCGLCSKEINYYKKIAPKNIFEWYDIATQPDDLSRIKVSQYDALMYLHAIDQNANLKIGVDAFILIWSKLRFWNLLSILVSLPIIYSLAKVTYNAFASYRFKKLTHCQVASQEVYK